MSKRQKASAARRGRRGIGQVLEPGLFKALGDPSRVRILIRLARLGRPCTVTKVAECCPTDISVVSRHLAVLREAGVLAAEKRGKEVYYSLRSGELAETLRAIADAVECCCPAKRGER